MRCQLLGLMLRRAKTLSGNQRNKAAYKSLVLRIIRHSTAVSEVIVKTKVAMFERSVTLYARQSPTNCSS